MLGLTETTMHAITQDRYGATDVMELKEISKPAPGAGQVLIRVQAASVNPLDWHIMRGRPFFVRAIAGFRRPKQPVRGVDVAGRVEAVGTGVASFRPGDHVFGTTEGAFAEYAVSDANRLLSRPAALSPEQAAAIPIAAITALQGLRDLGRIEPGHEVAIIGASGGVGTFAVQIAKAHGAEVTGVCSARNADLVRSIGADHIVDYTQEDFTQGDCRYDLIFQLAGTDSPSKLRRGLKPRGTLVLSSGMGRLSGIDRIIQALVLSPFVRQRLVTWVADENCDDLAIAAQFVESGQVEPVIDRTFELAEVPAAIRYVEEGHTRGKVVVTVAAADDQSGG